MDTTTTTPTKTDGLAVAGLVCGILGILLGWMYLILPILGIIFGAVGLHRVNNSNGDRGGKRMASAGLVTGIIGVCLWIALFALLIAAA